MSARLFRHRGLFALLVASLAWGGVVAVEQVHGSSPLLAVLRHAFEGAMVGGVADWFAVRALFRRIPIPLLVRHTNIISKNRVRLTEGIVDMVQNQWLAPTVVRERLQQVSLSGMALHYLQQPGPRSALQLQVRQLAAHGAGLFDQQRLVAFVGGLAQRHAQQIDVRAVLLRPLRTALEDDAVYARLWQSGRGVLRQLLTRSDVRALLHVGLEQLIDRYLDAAESRGVGSRTWARIKLRLGLPPSTQRREWLEQRLQQMAERLATDEGDMELAAQVRSHVLGLLAGLDDEQDDLLPAIAEQLAGLVRRLQDSRTLHDLLADARHDLMEQWRHPDSAASRWLADLVSDALDRLSADTELQQRLDAGLTGLLLALMERNPDAIGATVRHALSPVRLSDDALVRQIEDKVGDDLDWIRVNGAVVGGLVAGLLGLVQQLL